jgi:dimethylargininase
MSPTSRVALVRRPSSRLADGLVTHLTRQPVDYDLACRQWDSYVQTLETEGWATIEVPPADDCPDSVFVEDTMVVYGRIAVIARSRQSQARSAEVRRAITEVRVARRAVGRGSPADGDRLPRER